MNTNLSIKLLCATTMLGTATTICAQEDKSKDNDALNREMTLEREFDPTVQDANKVNTLPAVKEPEVTPRPIDYASFTSPADPEKQIATLPAGNVQTAIDYNRRSSIKEERRFFILLGYFYTRVNFICKTISIN